jgi:hypothetical protein
MAAKTDWGSLTFAIVAGITLGLASAFTAVWAGVPTAYVAPLTGAVVGAFIPLIYRLRAKSGQESPGKS